MRNGSPTHATSRRPFIRATARSRFLIWDRAGQFTGALDAVLAGAGIDSATQPTRECRCRALGAHAAEFSAG